MLTGPAALSSSGPVAALPLSHPCASIRHCAPASGTASVARVQRAYRKLRAPRPTRQVQALAGTDPVRVVHAAAVGGVDRLVAPARAVVLLGDCPECVALLD